MRTLAMVSLLLIPGLTAHGQAIPADSITLTFADSKQIEHPLRVEHRRSKNSRSPVIATLPTKSASFYQHAADNNETFKTMTFTFYRKGRAASVLELKNATVVGVQSQPPGQKQASRAGESCRVTFSSREIIEKELAQ